MVKIPDLHRVWTVRTHSEIMKLFRRESASTANRITTLHSHDTENEAKDKDEHYKKSRITV